MLAIGPYESLANFLCWRTRPHATYLLGVSNLQPIEQIWPTAYTVNKVLLEHSHVHLFTYFLKAAFM